MPLPQIGQYDITVTSNAGAIFAHLDTATVTTLKWEANGYGSGTITVPLNEPHLNELIDSDGNVIDGREIQVQLNSSYLATIIPAPTASPSLLTISGPGPAYHLKRRYVGRLNGTPNLALNASFDTDLTSWAASAGATQTWVSTPAQVGTGAVQLDAASVGDHYTEQTITVGSEPFDTFIWVTGWMQVAAGVDPQDLVQGRSIFTTWKIGATLVWQQGVRANWRIIGSWQRLKFKVFVPAGNTYTMGLRLYAPLGTVYYDELTVHREERLYLSGDPSTIICGLVAHAQDTSIGKVSANIGCDSSNGTGTAEVTRAYKYSERAPIMSAMSDMQSLLGGVDWTCESDGVNRDILTFERVGIVPAGKATLKWDVLDRQSNISDFTWTWTPDNRADKIIIGGRGSGDDFQEGLADTSDPMTPLGWEFFKATKIEATPEAQTLADGYGEMLKRPITLKVTVHRNDFFDPAILVRLGILKPCRIVRCIITQGPIVFDEDCKILDATLNPEPDTVMLNLIPISEITGDPAGDGGGGGDDGVCPDATNWYAEDGDEDPSAATLAWSAETNVSSFVEDTAGALIGANSWKITSTAAGDATVMSGNKTLFLTSPFTYLGDIDYSMRWWAVSPDATLAVSLFIEYFDTGAVFLSSESRSLGNVGSTPTLLTVGDLHTDADPSAFYLIMHLTFTATAGGQRMFIDNIGLNIGADQFCYPTTDTP